MDLSPSMYTKEVVKYAISECVYQHYNYLYRTNHLLKEGFHALAYGKSFKLNNDLEALEEVQKTYDPSNLDDFISNIYIESKQKATKQYRVNILKMLERTERSKQEVLKSTNVPELKKMIPILNEIKDVLPVPPRLIPQKPKSGCFPLIFYTDTLERGVRFINAEVESHLSFWKSLVAQEPSNSLIIVREKIEILKLTAEKLKNCWY